MNSTQSVIKQNKWEAVAAYWQDGSYLYLKTGLSCAGNFPGKLEHHLN